MSTRKSERNSRSVRCHTQDFDIDNNLTIVKEKYGSDYEEDGDEEDSEEAESEDEDGEELTPAVDAAILRTLARIKRKDPSIYQQGKDVFEGTYHSMSMGTYKVTYKPAIGLARGRHDLCAGGVRHTIRNVLRNRSRE